MTTLEAQNEVITNLILENQKLKQERDEAREQANVMREQWLSKGRCCENLAEELHEVKQQRDEAREALKKIKRIFIIALQKKIQEYIKNGSKGHLDLSDTPITSLPDGLEVGRDLNLRYTKITSLPDGLKVGGSLYLNNTNITSLPNDLKVGEDLNLYNTPIASLPKGLKVGGRIYR